MTPFFPTHTKHTYAFEWVYIFSYISSRDDKLYCHILIFEKLQCLHDMRLRRRYCFRYGERFFRDGISNQIVSGVNFTRSLKSEEHCYYKYRDEPISRRGSTGCHLGFGPVQKSSLKKIRISNNSTIHVVSTLKALIIGILSLYKACKNPVL